MATLTKKRIREMEGIEITLAGRAFVAVPLEILARFTKLLQVEDKIPFPFIEGYRFYLHYVTVYTDKRPV